MKLIDLTGQKFGLLTVIKKTDKKCSGKIVWECLCDCGNMVEATGTHLRSGSVKSCGCIMKTHGHSGGIGKTLTITELAEIFDIDRYVLYARLKRAGWNVEKVEYKLNSND